VATGLGAMLRLVPWTTVPAAVVWLVIAVSFRFASLASLLAAACIPLGALTFALLAPRFGYGVPEFLATAIVAAIVAVRHHENIARLRAGTESRIGEKKPAA
jgi:glycerol-3-phosphate acyltransferase PlsY